MDSEGAAVGMDSRRVHAVVPHMQAARVHFREGFITASESRYADWRPAESEQSPIEIKPNYWDLLHSISREEGKVSSA